MIARLTGILVEVEPLSVVLDVSGVGYLLNTIGSSGLKIGDELSFYTYLAVRENALDLYGFKDKEELYVFRELIKLPKIGPKTALQILSQTDLSTLKKAVASDDPSYLTKMSGIGKKSAEKIVAGLKDVFDDSFLKEAGSVVNSDDSDVIDALITLGYSQRDALSALQKISEGVEGTNERIKHALKELTR